MATSGVARRYAQAVYDIAREEQDIDGWLHDLHVIATVLREPTLKALLDNPGVSFEQKSQVIEDSFSALGPKRRNLVQLLVENGRVNLIDQILTAYGAEVNRARGIVTARVSTAVPMSPSEIEAIANHLASMTGLKVVVTPDVDPSLIGGFVARIGDRLIDGSVVGRLAALRARVMA
ncbi:MAG TPA: ATP synthase F1 subunit delta [Chloroflexota bacterium]|nr:ATP synthase F1 subunit delta [Chloroflexota bacterium]